MAQIISNEQIALNAELHNQDPKYGSAAFAGGLMVNLPLALRRMHEHGACNSFLDYGTGKGALVEALAQKLSTEIRILLMHMYVFQLNGACSNERNAYFN